MTDASEFVLLQATNMIRALDARISVLEARNPTLYLTPESGYTRFNDGRTLLWNFLQEPQMSSKAPEQMNDKFFHEYSDDDEDQEDAHTWVELDDAHWNATVLNDAAVLMIRPKESESKYFHDFPVEFWVGTPGQPVKLRAFVEELNRKVTREVIKHDGSKTRMLDVYAQTGEYVRYTKMVPAPFSAWMQVCICKQMSENAVILSSADIEAMKAEYGPLLQGLM